MQRSVIGRILLTACLAVSGTMAPAQDEGVLKGSWIGKLEVNGMKLTLVFNVDFDEQHQMTVTFDSPDQGVKGIPVGNFHLAGDSVYIPMEALQADYHGIFGEEYRAIRGTWRQSGFELPLILRKSDHPYTVIRPQDPRPPYPYKTLEVTFPSKEKGVVLSGTLTIPANGDTHAAIALATGSGPQNRDEEFMSHRPFLVLSDHLTRNGVMVLRYDDRGAGSSSGNFETATIEDFSRDLQGALEFLKSREEACCKPVGLLGHSEGGIVATKVANLTEVDFLVLLGSPSLPGYNITIDQDKRLAELQGVTGERLDKAVAMNRDIYSMLKENPMNNHLRNKIRSYLSDLNKKRSESGEPLLSAPIMNAILEKVCTPGFHYYINYDPLNDLEHIACPVYALYGELDLQVEPNSNSERMHRIFSVSTKSNYTIEIIPKANHFFQPAETGLPVEYSTIDITIDPVTLKKINDWISEIQ